MIPILSEVRWRSLLPGQISRLCALDPSTGRLRIVHESSTAVIEAPSWTPDGLWLVFNSAGRLWRTLADGSGTPELLESVGVADINNDHVLTPDGTSIVLSSEGDGHLYRLPLAGGVASRITEERTGPFGHFVIGISPDGRTLAVTGGEARGGRDFVSNLFLLPTEGCTLERLTDNDFDSVGCSWSPDGAWLYFNSERVASQEGHAQVFRMRPDGSGVEQLTEDDRVNWFPKPSPTGETVVWLSFGPGTVGHEANVTVQLRAMGPAGEGQRTLLEFTGGQGTMNVSSWSPTGGEFAFVAYPRAYPREKREHHGPK